MKEVPNSPIWLQGTDSVKFCGVFFPIPIEPKKNN